jgi:hypothetical protein
MAPFFASLKANAVKFVHREMNRFARMPAGRQLGAAFAVLLALMVLLSALTLMALADTNARARELEQKWLAGVGALAEARAAVVEMREMEVKHSHTEDSIYLTFSEEKITSSNKTAITALAAYRQLAAGPEETLLLANVDKSLAAYQNYSQQVVELGRENKQAEAAGIADGSSAIALDETLGALAASTQFNFAGARHAAEVANATHARARTLVVGLLVTALALGSGMALLIKTLINASVERVAQGSVQVERAGETMEQIVAAIGRVSAIVGEISAASAEQSSGVAQVGQAVMQMDRATQQNAALAEESQAGAESLKQQAQQLVQAVALFKLA